LLVVVVLADRICVTRFNTRMRNLTLGWGLGLFVATGVVSGSVENLNPLPEGLGDFGCGDRFYLLGVRKPGVVSRHFQAQSDTAIGQTIGFLRSIPGLKGHAELEILAKVAMQRVSNPSQWIDFTPTSGKDGNHAGDVFEKHMKFQPYRDGVAIGVKFAQPMSAGTSRDVMLGTLRWPGTQFVPPDQADWTMKVVFTNTQLGVFSLDVVFEKKINPEAN
jgi:hypothetical protein